LEVSFIGEKNSNLFGTEGTTSFHGQATELPRFLPLFAYLYTMDNGMNVAIGTTKRSAKEALDALYGSRNLCNITTRSGFISLPVPPPGLMVKLQGLRISTVPCWRTVSLSSW
jgi:hypothetical protein